MPYKAFVIILSVLALMGMLIGGTMAWFTSEAPVSNAVFTAGTVEVDVEIDGDMSFENINPGDLKDLTWKIENKGSKAMVFKTEFLPEWLEVDLDQLLSDQGVLDNIDIGIKNTNGDYEYLGELSDGSIIEDNWMLDKSGGDGITGASLYYLETIEPGDYINLYLRVKFDGAKTNNAYQGNIFTLNGTIEAIQASNDAPNDYWGVDYYSNNSYEQYVFENHELEEFLLLPDVSGTESTSSWKKTSDGFEAKGSLLLIENNRDEYVIKTRAKHQSSNSDGYGIFFETSLDDQDRDTGYVLQFDRGYANGEIIIRRRVDGDEHYGTTSPVLRHSKKSKPDSWWTKEHEIKLIVSKTSPTQKNLTVYIGNERIIDEFEIPEPNFDSDNNYTGFRAWGGATTEFYELKVSNK